MPLPGGQAAPKVGKTGKRKRKQARPAKKKVPKATRRNDTVLVKLKAETSFADAVQNLKGKVNPDDTGVNVRSFAKARGGSILFMLRPGMGEREAFKGDLHEKFGGGEEVRYLTMKTTLKIMDLDHTVKEEEVECDVAKVCGTKPSNIHFSPSPTNGSAPSPSLMWRRSWRLTCSVGSG